MGTFMKVLCSPAVLSLCLYICMGMYTGTKTTSSLAVSTLIPDRVKWRGSCAEFPNEGLQSLRVQEAEMLQTGNIRRQSVCKVCLGECVAITKSRVSATTNERSHKKPVIKRKRDEIQKLLNG